MEALLSFAFALSMGLAMVLPIVGGTLVLMVVQDRRDRKRNSGELP